MTVDGKRGSEAEGQRYLSQSFLDASAKHACGGWPERTMDLTNACRT